MNQVSRRNTWKSQVIIHKIFNKIFNKPKKKVLILTTIGAMASKLSLATEIVHTWYKIPICGYLYTLIEPNNTLQKLRLIRCIHYWWNVITNQYDVEFHLHKNKTKQCPKPWFIFIYNFITCWGFNTITTDLSPLDQWWQCCVWHVSHKKIINMKFKPTLIFAIICTLCLWFEYLKCLNNIRNKQPIQKEINIFLSKKSSFQIICSPI